MNITWHGHSCFRLTERGMATVVTDPYDYKKVGYSELDLSADIVTVSHDDPGHNFTKAVRKRKNNLHILTGPGEYEIGEVFITGIRTNHDKKKNDEPNVMYIFDYDGILVAHAEVSLLNRNDQLNALHVVHDAWPEVRGKDSPCRRIGVGGEEVDRVDSKARDVALDTAARALTESGDCDE